MIKQLTLLSILLCSSIILKAQSITGSISNANKTNISKVKLYKYQDGTAVAFDSCNISNSKFSLTKNITSKGIYMLEFSVFNKVNLYLEPQEQPLVFNADLSKLNSKESLSINKENEALFLFDQTFNTHKVKVMIHSKTARQIINKHITDTAVIASLKRDMANITTATTNDMKKIQTDYKDTYTAEILCPLLMEINLTMLPIDENYPESERAMIQSNFFNNWNLNDNRLLTNPYIQDRLFAYFSKWSISSEDGVKQAIDAYMSKMQLITDTDNKNFFTNNIVERYMQQGPVEALVYIADRYLEGCSDMPAVTLMKNNINDMRSIVTGQHYVNITGPDISGNEKDLSASLGAKATLILFWSSNCSHCMQEMPKFVKMYNFYKEKGFEVYAISLDTDLNQWKNTMTQNQMNWTNVCDGKSYQSPAAKSYFVYQTPAAILLDRTGTIVAKNKKTEELNVMIANLVNQN